MPGLISNPIFVGASAAILSVICTFAVRTIAVRKGYVAKPKSDRWHKRPTAMHGGIAIFVATTVIYFALVPMTRESLVVMGGAAFLFVVGLVDDLISVRPYQKLIGQLIGAGILVLSGLKLPLTGFEIVDIWITVFWVIGITNAINLLDNMDGLAAGISAIAAFSLALNFATYGQTNELLLISAFIGALVGFLVFNFNPASIFMGDSGSMFIGFLLSGSVLLNQVGGRSRGIVAILAVPVMILFVPIFDTTFVTVLRKLWGRKASQGGRDHTSHRLVALGLSERTAVLMLYGFAVVSGGLALLVGQIGPVRSFALIGVFIVVLVMVGVYLSRVKVYEGGEDEQAAKDNAVFAFLVNVSHKRRLFEVFLDAFLVTLAYYSAWAILYRSFEASSSWTLFLETLPLLILIKLGSFLVVGVYRGLWRYTSIDDFITFTKGVVLGSVVSVVAVLLLYRFQGFSRVVFLLDGILLLFAMVGSRMAFRVIRQILPLPVSADGRKVLIYGAGDGGEMVLRELNNNPEWNYVPVGFVDDDPMKTDKVIHGLTVFDGNGSLAAICVEKEIAEILISIRNVPPERLKNIREVCRDANVTLKRAADKDRTGRSDIEESILSLKLLKIEPKLARVVLIAIAIFCIVSAWFFMRWNFANAVATRLDLKRPESKLIIDSLVGIGPSDPQTHWAAAALFEKTFDPGDLERSLNEYELAVALSPNNYLIWVNLGRARSLNGDTQGAETAFKRALELAPNYSSVQWAYGNFLIREGKTDEGFKLAAKAAESNADYARSAVVTALQIFDGDLGQIRAVLGGGETTNVSLATTLAAQNRFEDAVESWSKLANKLEKHKKLGESLAAQLISAKKFQLGASVTGDLQPNETNRPVPGQIANGGFESEIKLRGAGLFEWQIAEGSEPQIGVNGGHKRSGQFGLLILFNSFETAQFRSVSQTVAVGPGAQYEFEGFYRSDLKTTAVFKIEIADAVSTGTIASTEPLALAGDWATMKVKFSVPAGSDGIIVRLAREGCPGLACRVIGKLSFDDFSIRRL